MLGLRLALGAIALMAVMTASVGGLALFDFDSRHASAALELSLGGAGESWDALASGAQAAANRCGATLTVKSAAEPAAATLAVVGAAETASCGSEAIMSPHTLHVGIANYSAGRICAQYVGRHAAAGSSIVVLMERSPRSPAAARLQGFRDTLRYFKSADATQSPWHVEVIAVPDAACDPDAAWAALASEHADAAIVFDFTGQAAERLQHCFCDVSRDRRPRLVSFDQSEASLAAIETGELAAIIAHNPYQCGYQAVDRLIMYHRSGALGRPAAGRGCINVPVQLVERGTLAEFRSELKQAAAGAPR